MIIKNYVLIQWRLESVKDSKGNEITEEMVKDLSQSTGISQKIIEGLIRDGIIRRIPGP
jgi:hypothetical protein